MQNARHIPYKGASCCSRSNMKVTQQILESLKQYVEYLVQDASCNPKVAQHVRQKIRQIEQS